MTLTVEELQRLIGESHLDVRKKNLYGTCPKCGGDEFGVSLSENHRFGCFRKKECGFQGNIFSLLGYLGKSIYEVKPGFTPRAKLENKLLINEVEELDLKLDDMKLPFGFKRIAQNDYLDSRGFTQSDYEKYKPGYSLIDPRFKDYLIFPVEQYGSNKAYVARSNKTKEEITEYNTLHKLKGDGKKIYRYVNSTSDFSKILLGINEFTENTTTAILVEGLFDKRNTDDKLGLEDQEEVKCVCTWKCAVSPEQVYLLQQYGIDTIILLYDPDVVDEIKKTAFELEKYFNVWVGFNAGGFDPGDMTKPMFDDMLETLKTPSQFSTSRVAVQKLVRK
jgi:DNA primase